VTVPTRVYDAPALYDLAFGYRNYAHEASFLRGVYERRRQRPPRSFLEIAAGPARHALAMAALGLEVAALDRSPAMAAHARRTAAEQGVELPYVVDDMAAFALPRSFDLAACMIASASYLLRDEDFVAHLRCVRAVMARGGIYVIELAHPSELDGAAKTKDTWTMRDAGGELDVAWISREESFDPADKTKVHHVRMIYRPHAGDPVVLEDESRQRGFSRADIEALVAAAGGFEIEGLLGALDEAVALDAEGAWRMVVVLGAR
jgi:SAM-dependent methyltransferase